MQRWALILAATWGTAGFASGQAQVGVGPDGSATVPTAQRVRAAGKSLEYHGRPVDLVLSHDGKTAYVKSNGTLMVVDVDTWTVRQQLAAPTGATMHGIARNGDGSACISPA